MGCVRGRVGRVRGLVGLDLVGYWDWSSLSGEGLAFSLPGPGGCGREQNYRCPGQHTSPNLHSTGA